MFRASDRSICLLVCSESRHRGRVKVELFLENTVIISALGGRRSSARKPKNVLINIGLVFMEG